MRATLETTPNNQGGEPPNTLFHLCPIRDPTVGKVARHPGLSCTLYLLHQCFWCTSMVCDARTFIAACLACAQGKSFNQPPEPSARPSPGPTLLWTSQDVTLQGHTVILTITNSFSKVVHFVPLPKFPLKSQDGRDPGKPGILAPSLKELGGHNSPPESGASFV